MMSPICPNTTGHWIGYGNAATDSPGDISKRFVDDLAADMTDRNKIDFYELLFALRYRVRASGR